MANKQLLQSAGDGTTVPAGYVGEIKQNYVIGAANWSAGSSNISSATSITLSAGVWVVSGSFFLRKSTASFTSVGLRVGISGASTGMGNWGVNASINDGFPITFTYYSVSTPYVIVSSNGTNLTVKDGANSGNGSTYNNTQTLYLTAQVEVYTGTPQYECGIIAVKIA